MYIQRAICALVLTGGLVLLGAPEARADGPGCRQKTWTTAADFTTNGVYRINVDTWWNEDADSTGAGRLRVNKGNDA